MIFPKINCKIRVTCQIYPSEDSQKINQSLNNIFENSKIQSKEKSALITSDYLETLEKIYEVIHSRKSQKTYRRILDKNLVGDSTWFYLNKQAAFVKTITLCTEEEQSPLGPIKIEIQSKNIEKIIDWLISD